jgi:hypothetical protein
MQFVSASLEHLASVDEEIDVSRESCAVKCFPFVNVAISYAACVASCASYGSTEAGVDEVMPPQLEVSPEEAAVAEIEPCDVKECIQNCGVLLPLATALYVICKDDCQKDGSNEGRELNCKPHEEVIPMDPDCVESCSIHMLVASLHKKCLVGCRESRKIGKLAFGTRSPKLHSASVQLFNPGQSQFLFSFIVIIGVIACKKNASP